MIYATFATIDLGRVGDALLQSGWDYVRGVIFRRGDMLAHLQFRGDHYVLIAA